MEQRIGTRLKDRPEFYNKPKPVTFLKNDKVIDAISIMAKNNFGSVVVTNEKLKVIKTLNNNEILSYVPSVKYTKTILKDNKNLKNIFETNFIFLYENNDKDLDLKKLNLIINISFFKIIGTFIKKKFYKWNKLNKVNKNITHANLLFLYINFLKLKLIKFKSLINKYN